jgi:hypothetical protein
VASEDREGQRPGLALLALAILVLAGCDTLGETPGAAPATTASAPTTARAARSGPPLTTHRDGTRSGRVDGVFLKAALPPVHDRDCPPDEVLGILQELTGAIASNPALAASFAKDDFRWYSAAENGNRTVPERGVTVDDAASFRAYLERRRGQHERLRLIALAVRNDGNFEVRLVRVADDLAPGQGGQHHVAEGKGKVDCAQRSVVAFSHAMFPVEPDYRTWPELFGSASAAEFEAAAAEAAAALRRHG